MACEMAVLAGGVPADFMSGHAMSIMGRHRLGVYRREAGSYLIEIRLRNVRQLFNTLDPSPFHEKDLDPAAEEYLVDAVREIGGNPCKMIVHLPPETPREEAGTATTAIRHYFAYRSRHSSAQLRLLLGRGAVSLIIGLTFLAACLLLRQLLVAKGPSVTAIVSEGLLILGWVAMWRPVEIFLYDWWPELGKRRVFDRLAAMPVTTVMARDEVAGSVSSSSNAELDAA